MMAAVFSFTAAGLASKSGRGQACFILNLSSRSYSFRIAAFSSSRLYGQDAVASSNGFSDPSSYCFRTESSFFFLRSAFSFSISSRDFQYKFLGIGFATTSLFIASGYGITLGFGLVRLNGSCLVGSFFLSTSPVMLFKESSPTDPLAAAAWENELWVRDEITCPVAFFSTVPKISATLGSCHSMTPRIFSSMY